MDISKLKNAKMARRVDVHKANLKAMGYENLEHWMEDPQHVYVGRNVVYVAGQGSTSSPTGSRSRSTGAKSACGCTKRGWPRLSMTTM